MRATKNNSKKPTKRNGGKARRQGATNPLPPTIEERTTIDPGDATGRNYRYQYAYGVILLAAAKVGKKPYLAIWCEHHEDFLAERTDARFDAYQIKTSRPELGPWTLTNAELVKSIGRFVDLVEAYGEKIADLFFVSNTEYDNVTPTSSDDRRRSKCPLLFLRHIRQCQDENQISAPFDNVFRELQAECGCSAALLFKTLKKLDIVLGPSRNDFEAVLSNQHLSKLEGCDRLAAAQLDDFRDELIARVHRASTLQVTDPARHLRALLEGSRPDPAVSAKKLVVSDVVIYDSKAPKFHFTGTPGLLLGEPRPTNILEQKLSRGDIASEIERMKTLERDAEYSLLEDIAQRPERYPSLLRQIEELVLGECSEAHLRARQKGEPYGAAMMIDVQNRLRELSKDRDLIGQHRYECLLGVASLLTSACRVWWSQRFVLLQDEAP